MLIPPLMSSLLPLSPSISSPSKCLSLYNPSVCLFHQILLYNLSPPLPPFHLFTSPPSIFPSSSSSSSISPPSLPFVPLFPFNLSLSIPLLSLFHQIFLNNLSPPLPPLCLNFPSSLPSSTSTSPRIFSFNISLSIPLPSLFHQNPFKFSIHPYFPPPRFLFPYSIPCSPIIYPSTPRLFHQIEKQTACLPEQLSDFQAPPSLRASIWG